MSYLRQYNELPSMVVGLSEQPPQVYMETFKPELLNHCWLLDPLIAETIPASDLYGVYRAPDTLVDGMHRAGFQQTGIYQPAGNNKLALVGHGAILPQLDAEVRVTITDPKVYADSEVAFLSIMGLTADAFSRQKVPSLNRDSLTTVRSLQADVVDADAAMKAAYERAGFRHRRSRRDFDVIACGHKGEEVQSHITTLELRHPDHLPPNESSEMRTKLTEGWLAFLAAAKTLSLEL